MQHLFDGFVILIGMFELLQSYCPLVSFDQRRFTILIGLLVLMLECIIMTLIL